MGSPACVDLAGLTDQFQRGGSFLLARMGQAHPGRGEADADASGLFTRRPFDFGLLGHSPSGFAPAHIQSVQVFSFAS